MLFFCALGNFGQFKFVFQALFEFKGRKLGSFETFWTFQIPKLGIEVPFLLVGHVSEPSVTLDRNHVNFKSLLIGQCHSQSD